MESTIEKMENGSIWSSIWDWLKGLFKKREEEKALHYSVGFPRRCSFDGSDLLFPNEMS